MTIQGPKQAQRIPPPPPPPSKHAKKMHAMTYVHITQLSAAVTDIKALGAVPPVSLKEYAYALEGSGNLSAIHSFLLQYNIAAAAQPPDKATMDLVMGYAITQANELMQNCVPNCDPAIQSMFISMSRNFTITDGAVTGINVSQCITDWIKPESGGFATALAYVNNQGSFQSITPDYPLAYVGLFMLRSDLFLIPEAIATDVLPPGAYNFPPGSGSYVHYDNYLFNCPWPGLSSNFSDIFPGMIALGCYQQYMQGDPKTPTFADYQSLLNMYIRALPQPALITMPFYPGPFPEVTYYSKMLSNFQDLINDQNPAYPLLNLPAPPFGPIQDTVFGTPCDDLTDVYDSLYTELSQLFDHPF